MTAAAPDRAPPDDALLRHGMRLALAEAAAAADLGEVPAGCVILDLPAAGAPFRHPSLARVLGRAHNRTETLRDPTAHAEMLAITQAAEARGDWRLADAVLCVTKEPCAMCAGAIVLARIPYVAYGVADPRRGGQSVFGILDHAALNHRAGLFGGVLEARCREQLRDFFQRCRDGRVAKPRGRPADGRDEGADVAADPR